MNWATTRNGQAKVVDTGEVTQLNLLRQESVYVSVPFPLLVICALENFSVTAWNKCWCHF